MITALLETKYQDQYYRSLPSVAYMQKDYSTGQWIVYS